jgi:hypothetical protein
MIPLCQHRLVSRPKFYCSSSTPEVLVVVQVYYLSPKINVAFQFSVEKILGMADPRRMLYHTVTEKLR